MEKTKSISEQIFENESVILNYKADKARYENEIKDLISRKDKILEEGNCENQNSEMNIKSIEAMLFALDKMIQRKDVQIKSLEEENKEFLQNPINKTKYLAWLKMKEIKPTVDDLSSRAKNVVDDVRDVVSDTFNKENISKKVEKVKESNGAKNVEDKIKVVGEELSELNLYKMIGQLRKNASESLEDISLYVKNNNIEDKIKNKVDTYVSPDVKGKVSSFFSKVKDKLNDAAEVIADSTENESEAERREKLRKLRGVKENYVKNWIKEQGVTVDNNVRNNIKDIHDNYLMFMQSEFGQEGNSKLIIHEYSEFVKVSAKYFNVPLAFNIDVGTINLKIV